MRAALTRVGVCVCSLLIALVVLEGLVRLAHPDLGLAVTVNDWDPDVGTRQVANARGFVRCREYDVDLVINSKGLRDREFSYVKPTGTGRILCLGDSFMCGYGVDVDETLAKVLERRLGARGADGVTWEVINAGVGSTGTAHQLALYLNEGVRYEPDIVVLGLFVGNDFYDSLYSGLYSLDDGELVKHRAPRTGARKLQAVTRWFPGYSTLFGRSRLLNLVKRRVSSLHYRLLRKRAVPAATEGTRDVFGESRDLVFTLLRRLAGECSARNATLVVILIPARPASPDEPRPDPRISALSEFLGGQGIAHVDLTPAFAAPEPEPRLTYPIDQHWTSEGHRVAAGVLLEFLESESLLDPPAQHRNRDVSDSDGRTPQPYLDPRA